MAKPEQQGGLEALSQKACREFETPEEAIAFLRSEVAKDASSHKSITAWMIYWALRDAAQAAGLPFLDWWLVDGDRRLRNLTGSKLDKAIAHAKEEEQEAHITEPLLQRQREIEREHTQKGA